MDSQRCPMTKINTLSNNFLAPLIATLIYLFIFDSGTTELALDRASLNRVL